MCRHSLVRGEDTISTKRLFMRMRANLSTVTKPPSSQLFERPEAVDNFVYTSTLLYEPQSAGLKAHPR